MQIRKFVTAISLAVVIPLGVTSPAGADEQLGAEAQSSSSASSEKGTEHPSVATSLEGSGDAPSIRLLPRRGHRILKRDQSLP